MIESIMRLTDRLFKMFDFDDPNARMVFDPIPGMDLLFYDTVGSLIEEATMDEVDKALNYGSDRDLCVIPRRAVGKNWMRYRA